jgi:hypothetical protein
MDIFIFIKFEKTKMRSPHFEPRTSKFYIPFPAFSIAFKALASFFHIERYLKGKRP